jgi:aminoglycoside phosphotransferase (APT) family kinase protein
MEFDVHGIQEVRAEDEFDRERLAIALSKAVGESGQGALAVWQFKSGASNLTYLLQRGQWSGVLRCPPKGPVARKAHDISREFLWLKRLTPTFSLAPQPYWYCRDTSVIGRPFYVMEYRPGFVMDHTLPSNLAQSVSWGDAISRSFVLTFCQIHDLDWESAGLSEFSHPHDFLKRQVSRWIERYNLATTERFAMVRSLTDWLSTNIPDSGPPTLIHNDFKLNNLIVEPTRPDRILAVVDWEMSTVGDPLFDLGFALIYWQESSDPPEIREIMRTATELPGFWSRYQIAEEYGRVSGRSLETLPYYIVLGYFKLAVIFQQIYRRWQCGQTSDPRFAKMGQHARTLIEHASGLTTLRDVG